MSERIFSPQTVELFKECIITAEDREAFPLKQYLRECWLCSFGSDITDPRMGRLHMDGILKAIDWTNPDEYEPIFSIVADAYALCPQHAGSFHRLLDVALAGDGFEIKDGEFLPLVI